MTALQIGTIQIELGSLIYSQPVTNLDIVSLIIQRWLDSEPSQFADAVCIPTLEIQNAINWLYCTRRNADDYFIPIHPQYAAESYAVIRQVCYNLAEYWSAKIDKPVSFTQLGGLYGFWA